MNYLQSFLIIFGLLTILNFIIPQSVSAQEQKNYYIYVEPIPDYAKTYASDVINDATTAWHNANPNINFYLVTSPQQENFKIQWIRDNSGGTFSGEALPASNVMQVTLGDSFCDGNWQPYSRATLDRITEHEIGHMLGLGHTTDNNQVMNPSQTYFQYGTVSTSTSITANRHIFVPLCAKLPSSYSYYVTSSNQNLAFNVYFVPSIQEMYNYENTRNFQYYTKCSQVTQRGWVNYAGICNNVPTTSGLLIIMKDELLPSDQLTYLNIKLFDQGTYPPYSIPTIPIAEQPSQPVPTTPPITKITPYVSSSSQQKEVTSNGYVSTENNTYDFPKLGTTLVIKVHGHVDNTDTAGQVKITWVGEDNQEASNMVDISPNADFTYSIDLGTSPHAGKYQVKVYYGLGSSDDDPNSMVGKTNFTVNPPNQQSSDNNPDKNKGKFCFLFWCW